VDLTVPADAEIIIEGTIDPENILTDGPFAEWLGYYGGKRPCYMIDVSCITMRKDAIYHDLAPSQRDHTVAFVLSNTCAVYDAVKTVVPSVKKVFLPFSGCCLMRAYVSIAQRIPGEANRAGLAAVNIIDAIRIVVVVDEDIDVYNEEEVLWAVTTRATPDSDITVLPNVLGCPLNPMSYGTNHHEAGPMNSKMIIDATKPVSRPFPDRVTPPEDLLNAMKLEDYLK